MQSSKNSTLVKLKIKVFIGIEHLLVTTISNIIAKYFFDPNLLPIGGEQYDSVVRLFGKTVLLRGKTLVVPRGLDRI